MSAQSTGVRQRPTAEESDLSSLGAILLVRIASAGGVTKSELLRDLGPYFAHRLSPAEWRNAADRELRELLRSGHATDTRGRLKATDDGRGAATRFLGDYDVLARAWTEQRDVGLIGKALGLDISNTATRKALGRPDGLAAFIVQRAFGMPVDKALSPSRLRAELAGIALARAFGNTLKAEIGSKSGLPGKAGRLLAGQLLAKPREITSDGRLIAHLAAEQVGAVGGDLEALRLATLRRFAELTITRPPGVEPGAPTDRRIVPPVANDTGTPTLRAPAARPNIAEFARAVHAAARSRAEGWSGSRKAFISHAWEAIRISRPEWMLTEIEFKCMLTEAHRVGQLVLANADLKDKRDIKELEDSAILYKNTVWHFIRVED